MQQHELRVRGITGLTVGDVNSINRQRSVGDGFRRNSRARAFEQIADAMSTRIMSCTELPRTAREDLLRDLASVPLVLEETADRQSRVPRGKRQVADVAEDES